MAHADPNVQRLIERAGRTFPRFEPTKQFKDDLLRPFLDDFLRALRYDRLGFTEFESINAPFEWMPDLTAAICISTWLTVGGPAISDASRQGRAYCHLLGEVGLGRAASAIQLEFRAEDRQQMSRLLHSLDALSRHQVRPVADMNRARTTFWKAGMELKLSGDAARERQRLTETLGLLAQVDLRHAMSLEQFEELTQEIAEYERNCRRMLTDRA